MEMQINNKNVPRGIRTPDLLVRSQTLYPAGLWAHKKYLIINFPVIVLKTKQFSDRLIPAIILADKLFSTIKKTFSFFLVLPRICSIFPLQFLVCLENMHKKFSETPRRFRQKLFQGLLRLFLPSEIL